jgi:hypothetical protein
MHPIFKTGVKNGKYVETLNGEKIYIPRNVLKWSKEGLRWKIYLSDGKKMLLPLLKE